MDVLAQWEKLLLSLEGTIPPDQLDVWFQNVVPRSFDGDRFVLQAGNRFYADWIRDNYGPQVVPAGKLFVLGDNRDNSRDSRFWGFLPRDQVKGRALLVYWSYEASREEYHRTGYAAWIRDTVAALGKTRWKRFFHLIR